METKEGQLMGEKEAKSAQEQQTWREELWTKKNKRNSATVVAPVALLTGGETYNNQT